MPLRITKHDIGAEIISILTRGMYPDPKDALREYVQNGIDADAENIAIRIRGKSIVVEDDGTGMNSDVMRGAVRVGISDKNPHADVGFRGIGIYSSFHLCEELSIYSKMEEERVPSLLVFDFKGMRESLEVQQLGRIQGDVTGEQLMDLQTILRRHIRLEEKQLELFPMTGTRVEMTGVDASFFEGLAKFSETANYLRQVVPLYFDKEEFTWAEKIEKRVNDICETHDAKFKLVNVKLQVNTRTESLYRPYVDTVFHSTPEEPIFHEIRRGNDFFGVAWGCLNPVRKKISSTRLRGFLLTKQGFALGTRRDMAKHFGKRTTYFDRYAGEVIVVNPYLLPNAARTGFEPSALRTSFYEALADVATSFNRTADEHQEYTLGDEQLDEAIERIAKLESELSFRRENPEQLLDDLVTIREIRDRIKKRVSRKKFRAERMAIARQVVKSANELDKQVKSFIDRRKRKRSGRSGTSPEVASLERVKRLPEITKDRLRPARPESLVEVVDGIDVTVSLEWKKILDFIDEKFIQGATQNRKEYLESLSELQQELEELFGEA